MCLIFSQNKTLTELDLSRNPIGAAGAEALKKALEVSIFCISLFVNACVCLPGFFFSNPQTNCTCTTCFFPGTETIDFSHVHVIVNALLRFICRMIRESRIILQMTVRDIDYDGSSKVAGVGFL